MRFLYVFLFLLSSTIYAAENLRQPLLQFETAEQSILTGRSRASSEISRTPSAASYATLAGGRLTEYVVPDITKLSSTEDYANALGELLIEYKKLLKSCKKTNTNVNSFLREQIEVLDAVSGAIDQGDALESKSETVRNGIKNLVRMYIELEAESKSRERSPDSSLTVELAAIKAERDALRNRVDEFTCVKRQEEQTQVVDTLAQQLAEDNSQLREKISELQTEIIRRDNELGQKPQPELSNTTTITVLPQMQDVDRQDHEHQSCLERNAWGGCSVM